VRHAQASFGAADYDLLSERGHAQCDALASDLVQRKLSVELVVSGSLVRQRVSAERVAARLHCSVSLDPRWNEYDTDDVLAHHSITFARPDHPPGSDQAAVTTSEFQNLLDPALLAWIRAGDASPTTESWPAFSTRASAGLADVASGLASGATALVFTSGGPLAALCTSLFSLPEAAFVAFNRVLVNTGITKVVYGRSGTTLVSFNEHAHLERDGSELVTYR
jgi:broad specificity phosphatase PhoE